MTATTAGTFAFPITAADDPVERLLSLGGTIRPVHSSRSLVAALRGGNLDVVDVASGLHAAGADARGAARTAGLPDRVSFVVLDLEREELSPLASALADAELSSWGQPADARLPGMVTAGTPVLLTIPPAPGEGDPVARPDVPSVWHPEVDGDELVLGVYPPHTLVLPRLGVGGVSWAELVWEVLAGDSDAFDAAVAAEASLRASLVDEVHTANVWTHPARHLTVLRPWLDDCAAALDRWHDAHDELLAGLEEQLPSDHPDVVALAACRSYTDLWDGRLMLARDVHEPDDEQQRAWQRAHLLAWGLEHGSDDLVTALRFGMLNTVEAQVVSQLLAVQAPGWVLAGDVTELLGDIVYGSMRHPDGDDLTLLRLAEATAGGAVGRLLPAYVNLREVHRGPAVVAVAAAHAGGDQVVFGPHLLAAAIVSSVAGRTADVEQAQQRLRDATQQVDAARGHAERTRARFAEAKVEVEDVMMRAAAIDARRATLSTQVAEDTASADERARLQAAAVDAERTAAVLAVQRDAAEARLAALQGDLERARSVEARAAEARAEAAGAMTLMRDRATRPEPAKDAARLRLLAGIASLATWLHANDHRWADRIGGLLESATSVVPLSRLPQLQGTAQEVAK